MRWVLVVVGPIVALGISSLLQRTTVERAGIERAQIQGEWWFRMLEEGTSRRFKYGHSVNMSGNATTGMAMNVSSSNPTPAPRAVVGPGTASPTFPRTSSPTPFHDRKSVLAFPPLPPYTRPVGYRDPLAFVITVLGNKAQYVDAAAVFAHSIRRVQNTSAYDYELLAIVPPDANISRPALKRAGYKILEREVPVRVEDIKPGYLKDNIRGSGCCGEKELLKLQAWNLTGYHRVVHADADMLFFSNIDDLMEVDVDIIWTCNIAATASENVVCGLQGGFFLLKPSMTHFNGLIATVLEGDYRPDSGWGGTWTGLLYGGKTIQGLLPYYFDVLHDRNRSLHVDPCIYNNVGCYCSIKPGHTRLFHFTQCKKPWDCLTFAPHDECGIPHALWRDLRQETEGYLGLASKPSCENGTYVPMQMMA